MSSSSSSSSFTIREGQECDLDEIHSMMLDLNVKYLKINCTPYALDQFKRDSGLLTGHPEKYFNLIVAQDNESKELLGYLLYYFMIKTSSGRHFYIEDIFVKECARKTGAGSSLIKEAASRALETQCLGMKLQVLHWNPARKFYESHGGKFNGVTINEWLEYDFDGETLKQLVKQSITK